MIPLTTMLILTIILSAIGTQAQEQQQLLQLGQEVYENHCSDCHRSNGEGLPVKFPALKGNAFVLGDPKPVLDTVIHGRTGKLGQMPAWKEFLDNNQIAAVVSYIRNAWGNKAPTLRPEDVAPRRKN